MRRFLQLFSVSVSLILFAGSCMPRLLISSAEESAEVASSDIVRDFTFKAGRHELSGLMMIRNVGPDAVRVVATTYFGMSLFDMTVTKDSYTMNSCTDFLDRKDVSAFIASRIRKMIPEFNWENI